MHTIRIVVALAALAALGNCHATITYSAEPIEGWVVDAETGRPLEDVVVLAHWQLRGGIERQIKGELMILETKTNRDGRFAFPGWGPKAVSDSTARLWDEDPQLLFAKHGYQLLELSNASRVGPVDTEKLLRSSTWNGKRIEIKSFKDNVAARESAFNYSYARFLPWYGRDCEWKQMPLLIGFLYDEVSQLAQLGAKPDALPTGFPSEGRCGSAKIWLQGIGK